MLSTKNTILAAALGLVATTDAAADRTLAVTIFSGSTTCGNTGAEYKGVGSGACETITKTGGTEKVYAKAACSFKGNGVMQLYTDNTCATAVGSTGAGVEGTCYTSTANSADGLKFKCGAQTTKADRTVTVNYFTGSTTCTGTTAGEYKALGTGDCETLTITGGTMKAYVRVACTPTGNGVIQYYTDNTCSTASGTAGSGSSGTTCYKSPKNAADSLKFTCGATQPLGSSASGIGASASMVAALAAASFLLA